MKKYINFHFRQFQFGPIKEIQVFILRLGDFFSYMYIK